MGFLERIVREYSSLTKSQQQLADYITGSYLDAAFLSSTELASQLDLDPGTVTRFAQRLGYDGYPELVDDVQSFLKRELRDIWQPAAASPSVADLVRQGIDNGRRNLEEVIIRNSPETFEKTVNALEHATRICVLASNPLAYHLGCLLRYWLQIGGFPVFDVSQDLMGMSLCLRDAGEGDVFVGVGSGEHAEDVGSVLRQARAKGAGTIGIVGSGVCAIAETCELNLYCPTRSSTPAPSMLAADGLLFILAEVLLLRKGSEVEEGLQRLEDGYRAILEERC
jgi:DNA-binding MurR/RpiR family transcriptional regulator